LIVISAAAISTGLSGGIAAPAFATGTAHKTGRPASMSYSTAGGLHGVAAVSKGSAWAVGYAGKLSAPRILMLHWNGTAWSRVTAPSVLTATGELSAIAVLNAKNAWAVGYTGRDGTGKDHSLLLHWNGSKWSQVTSPAPVTGGNLAGIAVTPGNGWAVGYVNRNPSAPLCCAGMPLVFRWNGLAWSRVATSLGKGSYLNGVAITAAHTAWAIGGPLAMITGGLAKWSGSAWSWVSDPVHGAYRPLNGIATGPGGTAFVVGTDNDAPLGPAVSARWTGTTWRRATVKAPVSSQLNAVTWAPGGTAWAAGGYPVSGKFRSLVMHWSGSAWVRVSSPGTGEDLSGLAFPASSYGWAVGSTVSASPRTVILHWSGTWK
jgi:hypothetical protein